MDNRLLAADAALKAGRPSEAADQIIAVVREVPEQPVQVYRVLVTQLYQTGRHEEGAAWSEAAVAKYPRDFDLWNLRGVILRRLKRLDEALKALAQAEKLNPKSLAPAINRGNVLNDMGEGAAAEAVFNKIVRLEPRNPEHQRNLARALTNQKKYEQAAVRLRQALTLKRDSVDAWLDLSSVESRRERHDEALAVIERGLAIVPKDHRLLEAKVALLRRASRLRQAAEFVQSLFPEMENQAWAQYQLAASMSEYDRPQANVHYRRAVELAPQNQEYAMAYAESLDRDRTGDEGANIQAGYEALLAAMPLGPLNATSTKIANEILIRVGDFERAAALGGFAELGREWATSGKHTALLKHLARVESDQDRLELVHQHRLFGELLEAEAAQSPLRRPAGPKPTDKIRVGFMSSDLRNHPVAYFALPLFEHIDKDRFEVYCYSYYQGTNPDPLQQQLGKMVHAFHWWPDIGDRDAAQAIAEDQLDFLVELGGTTHMNKLAVMAWRPARLSASWLGYPHSTGLSTIDYLIVDPYLKPPKPELLIERPLEMPHSWIAMSQHAFPAQHAINPEPPVKRNGFVTFGTANNPYKYSPAMLQAWARVVAATPDSRFMFLRPEGGASAFRDNMLAAFARQGVGPERIIFNAVRGAHMQHYNEMDLSLDTFPQTGGTTTCESLWMGVPAVTLVGEALFERLSYSILQNAGLPDLCTFNLDDFHATAVRLANDTERLVRLRTGLRDQLRASPLGRTQDFARDFYEMIAGAVEAKRGARGRA